MNSKTDTKTAKEFIITTTETSTKETGNLSTHLGKTILKKVTEYTTTKTLKKPTEEIFQRVKKKVTEPILTLSETFTKVSL